MQSVFSAFRVQRLSPHLMSEHLCHSENKPCHMSAVTAHCPSPRPSPRPHGSASHLYGLASAGHVTSVGPHSKYPWCLVSFPEHDVYAMCQDLLPFQGQVILCYVDGWHHILNIHQLIDIWSLSLFGYYNSRNIHIQGSVWMWFQFSPNLGVDLLALC